jgi:hypothetical protein
MRKRYHIVIIFVLLLTGLAGQSQYYYADTITVSLTLSQGRIDSIRNGLREKELSETMIDGLIEKLVQSHNQLQSINGRTVTLRGDTSFVDLEYPLEFITRRKFIVLNGRVMSPDSKSKEKADTEMSDSSRIFKPTGNKRTIKGYECDEFKSLDGNFIVWTSPQLPSTINPGINHQNLTGAILGYTVHMGNNAITRSQVTVIGEKKRLKYAEF